MVTYSSRSKPLQLKSEFRFWEATLTTYDRSTNLELDLYFNSDKSNYTNYEALVSSGARSPANYPDDAKRIMVSGSTRQIWS